MKCRYWIYLVLAVLLCSQAGAAEDETIYYAVFADGKKIGHGTHVRQVTKSKVVTTETMQMTVVRAGVPMTVSTSETCIETPDGKPLGFEFQQLLGAMSQQAKGTVTPDGKVQVTVSALGQEMKQMLDLPEGAVMTEGARLLALKKGMKEGTYFSVKLFLPSLLQSLECKVAVGPKQKVDLLGRVVTLTETTMTLHGPTGEITITNYVDKEFNSLKVIMFSLGMQLEVIACEKAFALSQNDVVDFLDKIVLKSPTDLEDLASAKSATYTLEPAGAQKIGHIVTTDSQTVRPGEGGKVIVTVRPLKAPKGATFPYRGKDKAALEALKSTRYLQCDHREIVNLAKKAVRGTKDAAEAAKRIESFVDNYVKTKSLSVGYATAVEVAASQEGDCSEHAVLAAAMCRAVGIPARIVMGYAYVPKFRQYTNVFGGHAWVEAYIGGKWVYLDATRIDPGPGHIAESVGDGDPISFFDLITTMGTFKIAKVTLEK